MLSDFSIRAMKMIKAIPAGRVATYGQIAALAGKPGRARGVGWILHSSSTRHNLPWHRVLNAQGKISFKKKSKNYRLQKSRLRREGIVFSSLDVIDMQKFQWQKRPQRAAGRPKLFS